MKILAVDTSSTSGSIAVLDGKTLLAEVTFGNAGAHSDWLLKNIDILFSGLGMKTDDIDLFAIASGPGSFTGLRVGISAVKGLAWSLGKKVVGVSTLKALALNLRYSNMTVCPVLDARKSEIYTALYRYVNDTIYSILDDCLTAPERLLPVLVEEALAKPVVFVGPGLKAYEGFFRARIANAVIAPEPLWHPRASVIGLLAADSAHLAIEPDLLSPMYLRKSEAETKQASEKD